MKLSICLIIFITSSFFAIAQRPYVIAGVNVIDVTNGNVLRKVNVFVDHDTITHIEKGKLKAVATDSIIRADGLYLIPGLWDMHTHNWSPALFPLLIANGITGVRDMYGDIITMRSWQRNMAAGTLDGPMMIASGPIVDGPKPIWPGSMAVSTAEEGRKAVDSLKNKLKVDFVKVYSLLPRDAYYAIAKACKEQQITFAGHIPNVITVTEAAEAGQKSQEHLLGFQEIASDSSDYYYGLVKGTVTDTLMKDRTKRRELLLRTYNSKKLLEAGKVLARNKSWVCATMVVNRGIAYIHDSSLIKDPRLAYMPPYIKAMWNPTTDFRFKNLGPDYFTLSKKEYQLKLQMIRVLKEAGVPMLAGTDYPNPYCLLGFSLHDELQILVQGGLTPLEALQAATINPARYLEITDRYGTIEKGKAANLVLLTANPLEKIENTTGIEGVFLKGKYFSKKDLQEMLEKQKAAAK